MVEDTDQDNYCIIITSVKSKDEARNLASSLIKAKLGGCVQILPVESFFIWENEAKAVDEYLLVIKTKGSLYSSVENFIKANHSYETPEIIRISIQGGLAEYLHFIDDVTI